MARQSWLLHRGRPVIEILLRDPFTGFTSNRVLIADTGAGERFGPVELILSEADTKQFGTLLNAAQVGVGGAIQGRHSVYRVEIEMPALGVAGAVNALGVPAADLFPGYDGFAFFRFLNAFTYGNFGNPNEFGLERPEIS